MNKTVSNDNKRRRSLKRNLTISDSSQRSSIKSKSEPILNDGTSTTDSKHNVENKRTNSGVRHKKNTKSESENKLQTEHKTKKRASSLTEENNGKGNSSNSSKRSDSGNQKSRSKGDSNTIVSDHSSSGSSEEIIITKGDKKKPASFVSAFDWLKSFNFEDSEAKCIANLSSDDSEDSSHEETWILTDESENSTQEGNIKIVISQSDESRSSWKVATKPVDFQKINFTSKSSKTQSRSIKPSLSFSDSDENILLKEGDTKYIEVNHKGKLLKVIHSSTIKDIVDRITRRDGDKKLYKTFLMALPFISSIHEVIEELLLRYSSQDEITSPRDNKKKSDAQSKVLAFLKDLLENNFHSFFEPKNLESLVKFIKAARNIEKASEISSNTSSTTKSKQSTIKSLIKIIQFQFCGINPNKLGNLITKMKDPENGIILTKKQLSLFQPNGKTITEERDAFVGSSALNWINKIYEVSRLNLLKMFENRDQDELKHLMKYTLIEPVELFNHLLEENLIISTSRKEIECSSTFKKKGTYLYNINEMVESRILIENIILDEKKTGNEVIPLKKKRILTYDPEKFAQNLSFYEMCLFKTIDSHEFYHWMKGDKVKRYTFSPNLLRFITFANHVSMWVSSEIISENDQGERVSLVKKFILIAQYCVKYKNYQGLLEIVYGLEHTSVQRLKAWKKLDQKYLTLYKKVKDLISHTKNWTIYRQLISKEVFPCVPYVGLFLSDLTFINDGITSKVDGDKINWKKISKISAVMSRIKSFQKRKYDFQPDIKFLQFIKDETIHYEEKALYEMSKKLEP